MNDYEYVQCLIAARWIPSDTVEIESPEDHGMYDSETMDLFESESRFNAVDNRFGWGISIDRTIEKDPCPICGDSMYYFPVVSESSYRAFLRCNGCGCGFEF